MTTFEHDDSGRVVRAVTVREPEFNDWDRAVLLADIAASKIRRGAHGLPLSETTDPANQFAYEVPAPMMDWAQKALDDAQESYKKAHPKSPTSGLLWSVTERYPLSTQ